MQVSKLMGLYQQQTGKSMEPGGGGSLDELQSIAAKQLGIDIPIPILDKM